MLLKREVEGVSNLIDSMVKKPNIYNNVKYSQPFSQKYNTAILKTKSPSNKLLNEKLLKYNYES